MKQTRRKLFSSSSTPKTKVYKQYGAISKDVPSFPKKTGLNSLRGFNTAAKKGQLYRSLPTKTKTNNITAVREEKLNWLVPQRKIFKPNS